MSSYGEGYYRVMEGISQQFLPLHNLNALSHLEAKLACFTQFAARPHEYYECFFQVEDRRSADATHLTGAYTLVEEEFKTCNESCKGSAADPLPCINACTEKFTGSVQNLYEAFYKARVGSRKEYKKARG
jgi:hypothetical protein